MVATARPRRSVLYMPGSNARALEKARELPADTLIFDLEDAVAPDQKDVARRQVREILIAGGYGARELVVRINGLTTPWGEEDVAVMATAGVDAVLVPKVENKQIIDGVEGLLEAAGAPDELSIWCMIETPKGVLRAEEIASASPRLGALVMGTSDLAKDLHCLHTPRREPFWTSLSWCILAARANGLAVLDGVHLNLDDQEGFEKICRLGREFGFDGKTLIHPKTLAAANAAYAPGQEEVDWSRRIITAHIMAERDGKGVVLLDGRLIEYLHVEEARRIVALSEAIAALEVE
ncbi:MAG: CoA ester lyase [Pseudomonadota bacterium]|nr:CoA ester lyase [Pseudomonadota bacterium]